MTLREFLDAQVYRREILDRWFARQTEYFGIHDGELGWLLRDAKVQDGVDGSISAYTYASTGERIPIHYAQQPCRIHTYGDSMTQCHQVSDGETWQEVLYVLSYSSLHIGRRMREGVREDQVFVDFLRNRGLPFVDLMEAHLQDFAAFRIPAEEYLKRYFIGHYNPLGNFFTAFAIKPRLVEFLDPKPPAYQPQPSRA